jgi:uncharacterized membrane protein
MARTTARRRHLWRTTLRVALLSLAATLILSAGIAVQMAAGHDPVLGPKKRTASSNTTSTGSSGSTGSGDSTGSSSYDGYGYGDGQSTQTTPSAPPVTTRTS